MEAKFVVNQKLRKKDLTVFSRIMFGGMRIVMIVLALCSWLLVVYKAYWYYWDYSHTVQLILALFLTLYGVFYHRIMGWSIWRNRNQKVTEGMMEFCEDCVRINNNLEEVKVKYDAYLRIAEKDECFFLFIQKRAAHVLPKDMFVQGDPAEFAAFIFQKTGLEVKTRHGRKK